MNRREAILAAIATLLGAPLAAKGKELTETGERLITGGCRTGKSIHGPWRYGIPRKDIKSPRQIAQDILANWNTSRNRQNGW